jgi:hypothetical protein
MLLRVGRRGREVITQPSARLAPRLTNSVPRAPEFAEDRAIAGIEDGRWDFYVHVGSATVDVIVAKSAFGNKYLKTDGLHPDNLLALPECP